jgi:hypothetical protein
MARSVKGHFRPKMTGALNSWAKFLGIGIVLLLAMIPSAAARTSTNEQYDTLMLQSPPSGIGCFQSTYPDAVWHEVTCGPYNPIPAKVGAGTDESAQNSGLNKLEYTQGDFKSASGIASESDSSLGTDYYSLQITANGFTCTASQGGHQWSSCHEQFIFFNTGTGTTSGTIAIEYWLPGYYTQYNTCPLIRQAKIG